MRALLLTVGSQGDVQPFVALAIPAARPTGTRPCWPRPPLYRRPGQRLDGVPVRPARPGHGPARARRWHGKHGLRHMLTFCQAMGRRGRGAAARSHRCGTAGRRRGGAPPGAALGQHLAELLGVPAVVTQPKPALVPTREFAPRPGSATRPGALNRPSLPCGPGPVRRVEPGRRSSAGAADVLALPPRPGRHDPLRATTAAAPVHGAARVQRPRGAATRRLAGQRAGHRVLAAASEPGWTPPRRLAEFLEAGEPVVYLGFGSMPGPDPERPGRRAAAPRPGRDEFRAVVASPEPRTAPPAARGPVPGHQAGTARLAVPPRPGRRAPRRGRAPPARP